MISGALPIQVNYVGDGTSTVFSIDLERDPYEIGAADFVNVFLASPLAKKPVGAFVSVASPFTVSLAYPVLTITFATPPTANPGVAGVYLTF